MGAPQIKLKQDVATRWNSTYDMFRRILDIQEPLQYTINSLQSTAPQLEQITSADINSIKIACDVLRIFYEITEEVSSEKTVSVSKVLLFLRALRQNTMGFKELDLPANIAKMVTTIIEQLTKRFPNLEMNAIYAQSALLDPRFKKQAFSSDSAFKCAYQTIADRAARVIVEVDNISSDNSKPTSAATQKSLTWGQFDDIVSNIQVNKVPKSAAIVELDKYLQEPHAGRLSDPLLWWQERKSIYPRLYELAKRRLCIVATSVPSERIFSKAGQTITTRRSSLSSGKVSKLLFLNCNM